MMTTKINHVEFLNIGLIQTNLNEYDAWLDQSTTKYKLPMSKSVEIQMWTEIQKGFNDVSNNFIKPHIIILPEVTVPHGHEGKLAKLCKASKSIVIAGLDFIRTPLGIQNSAYIMVPDRWPEDVSSKRVARYIIGKTFFSDSEKEMFIDVGLPELPDPHMYLFHAERYGNIGIAICSDFFDLERFIIYRGRIQHMLVIAHNQDTESYFFLAEAISRLVYCNVIICNTGFYGDSIAFSPYAKTYKRYIYRHKGQQLFSTQVVSLPTKDLIEAQKGNDPKKIFKSAPPGYEFLV
jgi:hypothetical protein